MSTPQTPKFYRFASKLDVEGQNQFTQFLNSPLFNRQQIFITIWSVVKRELRKKNSITSEKLSDLIWPNRDFNSSYFNRQMSRSLTLLQTYLVIREVLQNKFEMRVRLLEAMNKMGLLKEVEAEYNLTIRNLPDPSQRDIDFYELRYKLELQNAISASQNPRKRNIDPFEDVVDFFKLYSALKQLSTTCTAINRDMVLNKKDRSAIFIPEVTLQQILQIPEPPSLLQIYSNVYQVLTQPDEERFYFQLKQLVLGNEDGFPAEILKPFLKHLINYCHRRINEGHPRFQTEAEGLYEVRFNLEKDGKITPATYKNVCTSLARGGALEAATRFSKRYADRLLMKEDDEQKKVVKYVQAVIRFYSGDYVEVVNQLIQLRFVDIFFEIDLRMYMWKCKYELEEVEDMFRIHDSFRRYLRARRGDASYHYVSYHNFLKFFKKLIDLTHGNKPAQDPAKLEELKAEVIETKIVASYSWLLKKIDEAIEKLK